MQEESMNRRAGRLVWVILLGLCSVMIGCLEPADSKLESAGIGVNDMDESLNFYTQIVGMTVKCKAQSKSGGKVVLTFEGSKGSDVVLMPCGEDAEVSCTDVPAKLVYYVPDASALADAIIDGGYTILSYPEPTPYGAVVGMAKDPNGYWIEIVEDPTTEMPYLGAVGIGVSDLEASAAFYTNVLGMEIQYTLNVPNLMDEIILQYPYEGGGSGVVLMHYLYPRNYTDNPVSLGFDLKEPKAAMESIEELELPILHPMCGARGVAKDPDGYILEIGQALEFVEEVDEVDEVETK